MKTAILLLASMMLAAPAAHAHATFENVEAAQDSTQRMVARIPHGCNGEATLLVRIQIPDGLINIKPMPKAGWVISTVRAPYAEPFTLHGNEVTEGVREIVWEGELLDEHYDEFIFRARFTDRLPAGETLYIPIVQECATGAERWIEIPAAGQDPEQLEYPAPGVLVVPATN